MNAKINPIQQRLFTSGLFVSVLAFFIAYSPLAFGQGNTIGTISGRVSNEATGVYLQGARVVLQPSGRELITGRSGFYSISKVPPGNYRLEVSYTGLDTQSVEVKVVPGQRVLRDVGLTAEIYKMSKFTVTGEREGNALAMTLQRHAPNVKNIVSTDAHGNFHDANIGNFLQYVPGISTLRSDPGGVIKIAVRGSNPDLNSVSLDGARIANAFTRGKASASNSRTTEVDKIPAEIIERIEVTKALTPDQGADSIGGSVNLVTKSPLDYTGQVRRYMVGSSYDVDRKKSFRPMFSFLHSDTYGEDGKLGVLVNVSYHERDNPEDATGIHYEKTLETDRPIWFALDFVGEDQRTVERRNAGVNIDYKLSDNTRLKFTLAHSFYKDTMLRRRMFTRGITTARVVPGFTENRVETFNNNMNIRVQDRDRQSKVYDFKAGAEHKFGGFEIDYRGTFSTSEADTMRRLVDRRANKVGFIHDRSRFRLHPTIEQTSGPDIYEAESAPFRLIRKRGPYHVTDEILGGQLNAKRELDVGVPASLKVGLDFRRQEREFDINWTEYNKYLGSQQMQYFIDETANFAPMDGLYRPQTQVEIHRVFGDITANPDDWRENIRNSVRNSLQDDSILSEDVMAGYVMGEVQIGKLSLLGGLRVEDTSVSGNGPRQEITPEEQARRDAWEGSVTNEELARRTAAEYGNRQTSSGGYRDVFPSVHFKYDISPGLQARASWATGIGRPNFSAILPRTIVDHDDMIVQRNNPNLTAQYADMFDLMLEYYFEPAGMLTAGVFLKEINDFIYSDSGGIIPDGPDNGFDGSYSSYELRSNFNGGFARIRGWELAYHQQFAFLPGFWSGFGVFANYTRVSSKGDYGDRGPARTTDQLAGFVPRTSNVGVSYIAHGLSVRLKRNSRGNSLFSFSSDPTQTRYDLELVLYNLNVKYDISRNLSIFADWLNLFDTSPIVRYYYVPGRERRLSINNMMMKMGVSGRF